ncbi:hypothetical protein OHA91_39070 [Streptomyces erythrochromogenes]|uniref:Uncharacterized protein n=1 Tax=Streptomyces erythrochromogenes TaxID=285574 RepID=A0ABZ1Q3X9_9ACTN|nr:hypothetical protein [Streptomyces erythrochromogenes]
MGGTQDKRQEPGKVREEQQRPQRPQRPGQDPVHPEPGMPSRGGQRPEDMERRRDERDDLREDF